MKTPTDLDIDAVRAALSGRVIGGRLLHHDVLSSTMDEARSLAGEATRTSARISQRTDMTQPSDSEVSRPSRI